MNDPVVRLLPTATGLVVGRSDVSVERNGERWAAPPPPERLRGQHRLRDVAFFGDRIFVAAGDAVVVLRGRQEVDRIERGPERGFTIVFPVALAALPDTLAVLWSDGRAEGLDGLTMPRDPIALATTEVGLAVGGDRELVFAGGRFTLPERPFAMAGAGDAVIVRTPSAHLLYGPEGRRARLAAPSHPPVVAGFADGRVAYGDGRWVIVADEELHPVARYEGGGFVTALATEDRTLWIGTREGAVTRVELA